jgi:acyl-CoA synthetase (AMP-forming)/AMP-acid ligase II
VSCRRILLPDPHRPQLGKPDPARLAGVDSPPDALVRVMWSSGTGGGAKGSPLTRSAQMHRALNRRQLRGFGPHTRYFAAMPFAAGTSYARVVAALSAGGAVILPCPPADFVSLANTVGVTTTCCSPAMLGELLGQGAGARGLAAMEYFEVLGEHLPPRLAQEARLFLTPNLWNDYGSTETDRIATAEAVACLADPSVAGVVMPWLDVEIVDAADRTLPIGGEGRLRVRGPPVITGYYANPEATRRNFRDGWFYPGDLGVLTDHGLLRITGRVEDVIARDGVELSAVSLETIVRGTPGLRDVAVFPLPGADGAPEICAAFVLEPGADGAAVRRAVAARLGDRAPARVFVIESLPRNANGKVMRQHLAELARRGGPG